MASPDPRKEALIAPGPSQFTSETSPDQTVDYSISATVLTDMQADSPFLKGTPSESDFYVPDTAEQFCARNLPQARKKIARIQHMVDGNINIHTHNLLITGLRQKEIQQLLKKKHSGSRATFTDEQVLFQVMPGTAHEQLIVFLQQNFTRAMEAANCPMTKTTWVGIGATISKGRYCGKEPDWGMRPIADSTSRATNLPAAEEPWPSLVVEVGSSQSYSSLSIDAQWWWHNSGGATKLVLLFKIKNTQGFSVEVELWEEVTAHATGMVTRARSTRILERTQSTTVDGSGTHSSISLRYSTLMRQPPGPTHPEFVVLTREMLAEICSPPV